MQLTSNGIRALTVVRILAVLVLAGARCTDSRTADAGQNVAGQGSIDPGTPDARVQSRDAGATAGGGGTSNTSTDAGVSTSRDACAPLPCPSGASWNPMTCSCQVRDPDPQPIIECMRNSDCVLVTKGCCSCGGPDELDHVVAVPSARQLEAQRQQCPIQPACAPCPPYTHDPLAPIVRASCVAQRCTAVDLRSQPFSRCAQDSDCTPVSLSCCGATTEDPREYVAIDDDADAGILQCGPSAQMTNAAIPACPPKTPHADPISFCARDGRCALRQRERVGDVESATCYSPTQNLDHAYDSGAAGCDCVLGEAGVCRKDSTGRFVGLVCIDNARWHAVNDGPCGA